MLRIRRGEDFKGFFISIVDHFKQSGFHYEQEVLREHKPP